MKKSILSAGLVSMMMLGMTACSDPVAKNTDKDPEAKELGLEMSRMLGTRLGDQDRIGLDNNQLGMLRTNLDDYHADNFNRDSFVRGLREGLNMDTTDYSYIYGLREGLAISSELAAMTEAYEIDMNTRVFIDEYLKAFSDTLSEEQYRDLEERMQNMQMAMMTRRQAVADRRRAEAIESNEKKAKEYTAKLLKEGYTESKSGLVYKIIEPGTGEKAGLNDQVTVNYTGRHINGREFDSTDGRPIQMSPAGVVEGYREAMMMLGKGGKISIAIPGRMAYGDNGAPQAGITPNEMLVFDLEVVDILPADADTEADDVAEKAARAKEIARQMAAARASAVKN